MPHLYPPAPSDAFERELERRLALKYGFCVTCGIYAEHQQARVEGVGEHLLNCSCKGTLLTD